MDGVPNILGILGLQPNCSYIYIYISFKVNFFFLERKRQFLPILKVDIARC